MVIKKILYTFLSILLLSMFTVSGQSLECGGTGVAGDEDCEVCGNGVVNGDEVCDDQVRDCSEINPDWSGFTYCKPNCDGWDFRTCEKLFSQIVYDPSMGCIDTDRGDNIFVKGTCYAKEYPKGLEDNCDGDYVTDFSCIDEMCVGYGHADYPCVNGCSEGVCLPFISEDRHIEITNEKEAIILDYPVADCLGCRLNEKTCLPIGTMLELNEKKQFCDIDNQIKQQKIEDVSCNNNFECESNVCVNNQCISSNLLEKIINWFKSMFR